MGNVQAKRNWKCPWCQQEYRIPSHKPDPASCPECRKNRQKIESLPPSLGKAVSKQEPQVVRSSMSPRLVWNIFCAVLVGGMVCVGGYAMLSKTYQVVAYLFAEKAHEASQSDPEDKREEALVMAQQFIKDRLKSPSTASFGSFFKGEFQSAEKCVTPIENQEYIVRGWVDSQNSFGGTVRTNFMIRIKDKGSGKWGLIGDPVMVDRK